MTGSGAINNCIVTGISAEPGYCTENGNSAYANCNDMGNNAGGYCMMGDSP